MRIDYSEPKKSCSSPQTSQNRPRKESSGGVWLVVCIACIVCFGVGFGIGWMSSQRAAKKGFQAAMEQLSLENSPQLAKTQPPAQQPATAASTPQTQLPGDPTQPAATAGAATAADPPLSFYKTLPSGQKSNVLGSGINTKEEKPAKEPLQAAMPTNMAKPATPQNVQHPPAKAASIKPVVPTRTDAGGLTIQVASFSLKSEAETVRNKLAAKGYHVNIVESNLGDRGIWYRVQVGKHLTPDAAKELAGKLGKGAIAIPDKD